MSERPQPHEPWWGNRQEEVAARGYTLEWNPSSESPFCLIGGGDDLCLRTSTELDKWIADTPPIPPAVGGDKADDGKSRMDLLDTEWLVGVGHVLRFGAEKYAAHNWRKGIKQSRLIAAALRHLTAFNNGEDLDPESGQHHLLHASCCLMFAHSMATTRPDMDDRYKNNG